MRPLGPQITLNDNWIGGGILTRAMQTVNAFEIIDTNSADAMLLITLPTSVSSAKVESANGCGGNTIVDVYDVP